jgi:UDP-glucose 4-epimerase
MSATIVAAPRSAIDATSSPGFYRGKRIVVTGALGFLGTRIVEELSGVDCEIVRIVRRAAPAPEGVARLVDVIDDVRHRATWARAIEGADLVFHLAARTDAVGAGAHREADYESNVRPVLHFLDACAGLARKPALVFAGSVTQAGSARQAPGTAAPDDPQSVYDEHKLAAERRLEEHSRAGEARTVTLRLSNLYGPGPRSSAPGRGVLNAMIGRALAGEALTVYASGAFVRDYLHVTDAARAFLAAGEFIARMDDVHYVVGSGEGHTIDAAFNLVADRVAARTGRAVPVVHVEPPAPLSALEARSFVADASRFRAATGWRPRWGLAAGIDQTIEEMLCASS